MSRVFARWSAAIAYWSGHWAAFFLATLACVVWAVSGPLFGFSDTWQLVINTATTVLTFLAVFVIQNTQNRDALAVHLKLDEIIRSLDAAENAAIAAELASDEELAAQVAAMHRLAEGDAGAR
jgi:low affinity Fe/Cu permease